MVIVRALELAVLLPLFAQALRRLIKNRCLAILLPRTRPHAAMSSLLQWHWLNLSVPFLLEVANLVNLIVLLGHA